MKKIDLSPPEEQAPKKVNSHKKIKKFESEEQGNKHKVFESAEEEVSKSETSSKRVKKTTTVEEETKKTVH